MRYADHLKRSMDRLTTDAWEKQLAADPADRPAAKTVLSTCPCCGVPVVIGLAVTLLPGSPACAHADADDSTSPEPTPCDHIDTRVELTALTQTDLVPV